MKADHVGQEGSGPAAISAFVLRADHRVKNGDPECSVANAPRPHRTDVSALAAKIAALETAIAETADRWEPDGASHDAYAAKQAPAMTWRDTVELDATGVPTTQAPDRGEPPADPVTSLGALEQEVLRAIVADLVRSELRGDLGERITRNVRKLVRREMSRAMDESKLESLAVPDNRH